MLRQLTACVLMIVGAPALEAQDNCMTWVCRHNEVPGTGVGSPGQRAHHAMAYDSDRGVTVFFGGETGPLGSQSYYNDTWEYDGTHWRAISVATATPSPRSFHAMAYDRFHHQVVLLGGQAGGDSFSDFWTYTGDGVNGFWTNVPPNTNDAGSVPFNLAGSALVFDSARNYVLSLGGWNGIYTGDAQIQCDGGKDTVTYLWDGAIWRQDCNIGGNYTGEQYYPVGIAAVYGVCMAFDDSRRKGIALGGFIQANEQNFVGGDFYQYTPGVGWVDVGPGPAERAEAVMAYDSRRAKTVLVGGVGAIGDLADALEYDPVSGWVSLPSIPNNPTNNAPSARAGAAMVFDSRRNVFVLMGGAGAGAEVQVPGDVTRGVGSRFSDTWELGPEHVTILQDLTNSVVGNVCGSVQLSVSATGNGRLNYHWYRDGQAVTDDAHYLGSTTNVLNIQSLLYNHAGAYDVVISDDCGTLSTVTSAVAQVTIQPGPQWVLRTTNGPSARTGAAMAYDSLRGVTVLFGGLGFDTNFPNQLVPLNDVWEWDGTVWHQRMTNAPANGWVQDVQGYWHLTYAGPQPAYRYYHSLAYDSLRGLTVLFGGEAPDPSGFQTSFNDTWVWDYGEWYFETTNGPAPRFYAAMAYNSFTNASVLYGGFPSSGNVETVWNWNGTQWTGVAPSDPIGPYSQEFAGMAYDSFRNVTFYGPAGDGFNGDNFYDWDGTNWTLKSQDLGPGQFVPLSGGMAFDNYQRRVVYFGGNIYGTQTPTNSTLLWDGAAWTVMPTNAVMPSPRAYPAVAYDSRRHAFVVFGGQISSSGTPQEVITNETWELLAVDNPIINQQPASQFHNPGDTAVFSVAVLTPGGSTPSYSWRHGANVLLEGGRFSGTATATLQIANVNTNDSGPYFVDVSCNCGTVTSLPAYLTLSAKLQIFLISSNSALLTWSAPPSVFLEQATSPAGPWSAVQGASSPLTVAVAGKAKFFRLSQTNP